VATLSASKDAGMAVRGHTSSDADKVKANPILRGLPDPNRFAGPSHRIPVDTITRWRDRGLNSEY
jgi:hypothetical protein